MPARLSQPADDADTAGFAPISEEPEEDDITPNSNGANAAGPRSNDSSDIYRVSSPAYSEMAGEADMGGEKRDRGDVLPVLPWRGILKKSNSKVNLTQL